MSKIKVENDSLGRIYYVPNSGSFYKIVLRKGKFYVQVAPAMDGYLLSFDRAEFTELGYMGNDPNGFDTLEQAKAFIKGMRFVGDLV